MKKLVRIAFVVFCCFSLLACTSSNDKGSNDTNKEEETPISFNNTFTFDDLEITFKDDIQWHQISNQYSDHDGAEVFSISMTITNKKSENHGLNMFYFTQYGSKGTKLDSITAYFNDDVSWAGDMRPDATLETRMYVLYDGDGDYYIKFSNFSTTVEVLIPITK